MKKRLFRFVPVFILISVLCISMAVPALADSSTAGTFPDFKSQLGNKYWIKIKITATYNGDNFEVDQVIYSPSPLVFPAAISYKYPDMAYSIASFKVGETVESTSNSYKNGNIIKLGKYWSLKNTTGSTTTVNPIFLGSVYNSTSDQNEFDNAPQIRTTVSCNYDICDDQGVLLGKATYSADKATDWDKARHSDLMDALQNPFTGPSGYGFTGNPLDIYPRGFGCYRNKNDLQYMMVWTYEDDDLEASEDSNDSKNLDDVATAYIMYSSEPIYVKKNSDGNVSGLISYMQKNGDKCYTVAQTVSYQYSQFAWNAAIKKYVFSDTSSQAETLHYFSSGSTNVSLDFVRIHSSSGYMAHLLYTGENTIKTDNGTSGGGDTAWSNPDGGGGGGSSPTNNDVWKDFDITKPSTWFTPIINTFNLVATQIKDAISPVTGLIAACIGWMPAEWQAIILFAIALSVVLLILGRR